MLSTVHTLDAAESINRIIEFFPPHQHQQARAMIAGTVKGIISQRLVASPDGKGRVAATEILTMTGRARDMIMNPDETGRLREVIQEGEYLGSPAANAATSAGSSTRNTSSPPVGGSPTAPPDRSRPSACQPARYARCAVRCGASRGDALDVLVVQERKLLGHAAAR